MKIIPTIYKCNINTMACVTARHGINMQISTPIHPIRFLPLSPAHRLPHARPGRVGRGGESLDPNSLRDVVDTFVAVELDRKDTSRPATGAPASAANRPSTSHTTTAPPLPPLPTPNPLSDRRANIPGTRQCHPSAYPSTRRP